MMGQASAGLCLLQDRKTRPIAFKICNHQCTVRNNVIDINWLCIVLTQIVVISSMIYLHVYTHSVHFPIDIYPY